MVEGWLVGQLQPSLQHCSTAAAWINTALGNTAAATHTLQRPVMGIQSDENTYYSVGCVSVSA